MYAWPIYFPDTTNREDFFKTIAIFDDDTGQALNLAGIALVSPQPFTASSWTVVANGVPTTSTSTLTIPYYPIGNTLLQLALTVGLNLNIIANSPVVISHGNNSMTGYVTSYVASTGAMVCQIGWGFHMEIRRQRHHRRRSDYSPWYNVGGDYPFHQDAIIRAWLGNGLTITDLGYLTIDIPYSEMQRLRLYTYEITMVGYDGAPSFRQIFLGELPVLDAGGPVPTPPFNSTNSQQENIF
jgi:hypothetical protein